MAVRILIVDDSAIFRQGLRTMLEEQRDWAVCGQLAEDARKIGVRETLSKTVLNQLVDSIHTLLDGQSSAAQEV
jgi:chemotaxis response regulator CheB